jgi:hypothetical protein
MRSPSPFTKCIMVVVTVLVLASLLGYARNVLTSCEPKRIIKSAAGVTPEFSSKDFKAEFGYLTKDDPYLSLSVILTPLKKQTGYGEIHCAFYNKDNYLIDAAWTNWNDNVDSNSIVETMRIPISKDPITRIKCWTKYL